MVTLVVLLDYSAAFDTVDHGVMLDVLKYRLGLTGSALQWDSNYLSGRSFAVVSVSETSTSINLECSCQVRTNSLLTILQTAEFFVWEFLI